MRLLLDTHVVIWLLCEPQRLSRRASTLIGDAENEIFISMVSAWEIATKVRLGKLDFDTTFLASFDEEMRSRDYQPLAVSSRHAVRGANLPGNLGDPFDRMLAGIALVEHLQLVSADSRLKSLGIEPVW